MNHPLFSTSLVVMAATVLATSPLVTANTGGDQGSVPNPAPSPAASPAADPAPGISVPLQDNAMKVYWKDSLRFETEDKQFSMEIGGRLHLDWTFVSGDEMLQAAGINTNDKVDFRRSRLQIGGTVYENVDYYAAYELSNSTVVSRGIYLRFPNLFGGDIMVGNFKEPFSLEELTSSNYLSLLERGLPNALVPSWQTGAMYSGNGLEGDLNYAVGFFRSQTEADGDSVGDGEYAVTGRVAYALRDFLSEEANLLHFGAAFSSRSVDGYTISARPEARTAGSWVSTTTSTTDLTDADGVQLLGLETAGVFGPFSLQAEYIAANVDSASTSDPELTGWYALASYFLTGESRPYKGGTFGRVRPNSNWRGFGDGSGAVEVVARVSNLDLGEAATGQELDNVSLGLNWYLNPAARIMTNVVQSDVESADSDTTILGVRFQVTF